MHTVDISKIDFTDRSNKFLINVGVSNRHLHLSEEHLHYLFGEGAQLTPTKDLTQPGQFAAAETVTLVGPKGTIEKMRVLGPVRAETQVELAQTDARKVGIKAPLRNSGDLDGTPGCILIGPKGYLVIDKGVIVAKPHLHLNAEQGAALGVKDNDYVDFYFKGAKEAALFRVWARVGPKNEMDLHIDTDEANAFGVGTGSLALLVKRD